MSKNIKPLPSGAKLHFPKRQILHADLTLELRRFVKGSVATTLIGSIPLEDVPRFLEEVKLRHVEIVAEQKEIRRQYDAAHPQAKGSR